MRTRNGVLLGTVLLAAFIWLLTPIQSDDLFMYLALGRRWFANLGFGATDPFLFTIKDYHWHLWHEWLSYLIDYGIFQGLGFRGLIAARAVLVAVATGLIFRTAMKGVRSSVVALVVTAAAFCIALPRADADRCSFFSDLLTLGLIYVLIEEVNFPAWLWAAAFAIWAQLHPGFPLGWAFLGLFILCRFHSWNAQIRRRWLAIFCMTLAATFLNPIGWRGVIYPFEKFFSPEWAIYRELNSEWMRTYSAEFLSLPYKIFLGLLSLVALGLTARNLRRDPFSFFSTAALCLLGWSAVRFLSLAGFGLGLMVAMNWPWRPKPLRNEWMISFTLAVAAAVAGLWFRGATLLQANPLHEAIPLHAVDFLQTQPPGNIFNEFDFGGYLAWRLDGRMKIAAHGHIDSPALVIQNYHRFSYSLKDWTEIILKNHVEYFLVHTRSLLEHPDAAWVNELKNHWQMTYQDGAATVFRLRPGG